MSVAIGPRSREQFNRLGRNWKQGEHILISGGTGSGKTTVGRQILNQRIVRNGAVIVFVGKLTPDETILSDYKGFTRWHSFKRNPSVLENKVLLWPNTNRYKTIDDKRKLQRQVFGDAFNHLSNVGKWTVQIDEGLYTVDPTFLNLGSPLAMLHNMGRSSKLTLMTLTQRPAHLPLVVYSNVSHAFVGRTRELADQKRMAELGGRQGSRELMKTLSGLQFHDFMWIPSRLDGDPELVRLTD